VKSLILNGLYRYLSCSTLDGLHLSAVQGVNCPTSHRLYLPRFLFILRADITYIDSLCISNSAWLGVSGISEISESALLSHIDCFNSLQWIFFSYIHIKIGIRICLGGYEHYDVALILAYSFSFLPPVS